MKHSQLILWGTAICIAIASPAWSGKSSAELGKKLFDDPTFAGSTNEYSCKSCHENGKNLKNIGNRKNLAKIINRCITGPLGGTKIDGRSVQMRSLKLYLQSLSQE